LSRVISASSGCLKFEFAMDTIAGDVTAAKIGFNFAAFNGWKFERSLVAFCHGGIFLFFSIPFVKYSG
jgi:hypothetical protein